MKWTMEFTDACKEDPKDKSYIYVWCKDPNPKFKPNIMSIYFENNKYWYDSCKRSEFAGIVIAWCYAEPPEWVKWEGNNL